MPYTCVLCCVLTFFINCLCGEKLLFFTRTLWAPRSFYARLSTFNFGRMAALYFVWFVPKPFSSPLAIFRGVRRFGDVLF